MSNKTIPKRESLVRCEAKKFRQSKKETSRKLNCQETGINNRGEIRQPSVSKGGKKTLSLNFGGEKSCLNFQSQQNQISLEAKGQKKLKETVSKVLGVKKRNRGKEGLGGGIVSGTN